MKNEKKTGIVYTVKCKATGKYYVGATTNTLKQRKLDHLERASRGENNKFHEAIATYGPEAFEWEQTQTALTTDELALKEKEFIDKLDSKSNGYNSDAGGGIKKTVYQYSTVDGHLVNSFDSLQSAANAVSASRTGIGNACIGQNKTCKGFYWSYTLTDPYVMQTDSRKKRVGQYTLKGKLIAEFESVSESSKVTGVSKTCIARVCRGERRQSSGYIWKYLD